MIPYASMCARSMGPAPLTSVEGWADSNLGAHVGQRDLLRMELLPAERRAENVVSDLGTSDPRSGLSPEHKEETMYECHD